MASLRSEASLDSSSQCTFAFPIPYRVRPFDYQPAVVCKCGVKAARWISWSIDNLGRRYYKCPNARTSGCDFFAWYEGPMSSFLRDLLNDLRDAVWSLRREKEELVAVVEEGKSKADKLDAAKRELAMLKKLVAENDAKLLVLKDRNSRLEHDRCVLIIGFLAMICGMFVMVLVKN